ncbi:MAG: hypothetical protein R2711_01195 [Acidimicrobiales bacterium]
MTPAPAVGLGAGRPGHRRPAHGHARHRLGPHSGKTRRPKDATPAQEISAAKEVKRLPIAVHDAARIQAPRCGCSSPPPSGCWCSAPPPARRPAHAGPPC